MRQLSERTTIYAVIDQNLEMRLMMLCSYTHMYMHCIVYPHVCTRPYIGYKFYGYNDCSTQLINHSKLCLLFMMNSTQLIGSPPTVFQWLLPWPTDRAASHSAVFLINVSLNMMCDLQPLDCLSSHTTRTHHLEPCFVFGSTDFTNTILSV